MSRQARGEYLNPNEIQIVHAVHGQDHAVTDRSVDVQIVGLRKKLGDAGSLIETS